MLKTIARQISKIDRLVRSRDDLDRHVERLCRECAILRDELESATRENQSLKKELTNIRSRRHFVSSYQNFVRDLMASHPLDKAMLVAVGGNPEAWRVQMSDLDRLGIKPTDSAIELGCGSGQLTTRLGSRYPDLDYLGIDVVPELLAYAARHAPQRFRFVEHSELSIPAADQCADLIIAFSVFTHLRHEESFLYLKDMSRVLRGGGRILFSFIETERCWPIFQSTVAAAASNQQGVMNTFIERPQIQCWAEKLGLLLSFPERDSIAIQSVATLLKPPCRRS